MGFPTFRLLFKVKYNEHQQEYNKHNTDIKQIKTETKCLS